MTDSNFAEQLQNFQQAYTELITIAEHYPEVLQTEIGALGTSWSAREVLAHINGWLVEMHRRFPRYAKGTGNIEYNHDAFNSVSVWLRDGKDFEQILSELRTLVAKTIAVANDLPDPYIEREKRYGLWLETMTQEAQNHGNDLKIFLKAHT